MSKYQSGKIYKIVSDKTNLIYIGCTMQTLKRRFASHKSQYKLYLNGYTSPTGQKQSYCASYDILKVDPTAKIILEYDFPCEDREELESEEIRHAKTIVNVCNKNLGITKEPNYYINKSQMFRNNNPNYNKEYHEANRTELLIKKNTKYSCDCGGKYTRSCKAQHNKTNKHQIYLTS